MSDVNAWPLRADALEVISARMRSGKTSYLYALIAEEQKLGQTAFVDMEGTFNAERAAEFGIDLDALILENAASWDELVALVEKLKDTVRLICVNGIWAAVDVPRRTEMHEILYDLLRGTNCTVSMTLQPLPAARMPQNCNG